MEAPPNHPKLDNVSIENFCFGGSRSLGNLHMTPHTHVQRSLAPGPSTQQAYPEGFAFQFQS